MFSLTKCKKYVLTDMSVALIQHENGAPQRSTLGLEQLKYSFFPQSKYPS